MPTGRYTAADLAAPPQQQTGTYTAADIDGSTSDSASAQPNPTYGSSIGDTLGTVGTHLKNMVAGPYHAFADAPRNPEEQAIKGANSDSGSGANALGQFGLGVYRMAAQPTVDNAKKAYGQLKTGGYSGAARSAESAVPLVGPWADNIENDVRQKGAVAGLTGMATDAIAPKLIAAGFGTGLKAAGMGTRLLSSTPESQTLAATKTLVPGSPAQMLTRGLKPSTAYPDFEQSAHEALPALIKQRTAPGVKGFADAAQRAQNVEQDWYNTLKAPHENEPIDTTPLIRSQVNSIPTTNRFETPGLIPATRRMASSYDMTPQSKTVTSPILDEYGKPITRTETTTPEKPTLATVDDIRKDTNQKLKSSIFKDGGDRAAAMSNPNTARLGAVN